MLKHDSKSNVMHILSPQLGVSSSTISNAVTLPYVGVITVEAR